MPAGCCSLIALGYGVTRPQAPAHDQALSEWLSQHQLTTGPSSYADGNSLVLDSHSRTWRKHLPAELR
jgi:hypothetical protein